MLKYCLLAHTLDSSKGGSFAPCLNRFGPAISLRPQCFERIASIELLQTIRLSFRLASPRRRSISVGSSESLGSLPRKPALEFRNPRVLCIVSTRSLHPERSDRDDRDDPFESFRKERFDRIVSLRCPCRRALLRSIRRTRLERCFPVSFEQIILWTVRPKRSD